MINREAAAKLVKEEAEAEMKALTDQLKLATEKRNVAREEQHALREERYSKWRDELQQFKGGLAAANEGATELAGSGMNTVEDLRKVPCTKAVLLIPADDGTTTVKFVSREIIKAAASIAPAAAMP